MQAVGETPTDPLPRRPLEYYLEHISDALTEGGYQRRTVQGDGASTTFEVTGLPETARDFLFKLNSLSLDEVDYTWNFGGTDGDLQVRGFIPLAEDVIEIFFRS
jgi:hypothetical protein